MRYPLILIMTVLLVIAAGCGSGKEIVIFDDHGKIVFEHLHSEPRARMGSYASSTLGTRFYSLEDLGTHNYYFSRAEGNGILYTCRAGHIDSAHFRKSADWSVYLAALCYKNIMQKDKSFSFKSKERSRGHVHLTYPSHWGQMSQEQQQEIAFDISVRLGQYFSWTLLTWHEILTWFGFKCTGLYSEFPSAFSWEDSFSNLLGCHLAGQAIRDRDHNYNEALTLLIEHELTKLGVQRASVAKRASKMVRGKWYSGNLLFMVSISGRNLDIGLDDGYVTPWLVDSLVECPDAQPQEYPVPTLDFLSSYGFEILYEIEPKEWESDKILDIVYPDLRKKPKRIQPLIHFKAIMDYIQKDAKRRYPNMYQD